eukprot:scaffold23137_cov66-Phaeocystis_antarctica.AAC.13
MVEVSGDDHISGLAQKVHHVEVGWHESLELIAKHVGSLSSSKRMLGEVVRLAPQGFITDPIVTGPLVFKEAAIHAVVVINGYSRRLKRGEAADVRRSLAAGKSAEVCELEAPKLVARSINIRWRGDTAPAHRPRARRQCIGRGRASDADMWARCDYWGECCCRWGAPAWEGRSGGWGGGLDGERWHQRGDDTDY